MKGRRAAFFLLVTVALAVNIVGNTRAAEFSPPSHVTEVTVYRSLIYVTPAASRTSPAAIPRPWGHALVTREARLTLPPGDHRILLTEIPSMADPDSVRVSGTGAGGVSIGGVEVRQEYREAKGTPEYREIEEELETLGRRQASLENRQESVKALRDFLASLRASAGEEASKDLLTRGFAVESWQDAFEFISGKLDDLASEELGIRTQRKDLSEQIEVARSRLAQLASQGGIQRWTAEILVAAPQGGEVTLKATYLAGNASWTPHYDARLDPATGEVEIVWKAQIAQNTGEDWKDVPVTLSTTLPTGSIELPQLTSLQLQPVSYYAEVDGANRGYTSEMVDQLPVLGKNYQDVLTPEPGVAERVRTYAPPPPPPPLAIQEAATSRRVVAVTFDIPGRLDIPSDGQPHQHRIAARQTEGAIEYHSVPRIVPKVYLVAQLTLPGEIPILPGRVQHFVGMDLVGSSQMTDRAAGEDFTLSFGPDDRLKAERKRIYRKVDPKGRFTEIDYRFVTSLENHLTAETSIELKDLIPTSSDDRVTVTLDDRETTAGYTTDPNEPGILTWKVSVPAAGKQEIVLQYRVRFPKDLEVAGLE